MRALAFTLLALGGCGRLDFASGPPDSGFEDAPLGDGSLLGLDLEFYFPLDETSGHTIPDATGSARDGYAWDPDTHMQWLPAGGMIGGGLHFDGTGYESFALYPAVGNKCGTSPTLTGNLTLAAWAKFDSFTGWGGYSLGNFVIGHGQGGGLGGGWGLGATNGCGAETIGFEVGASNSAYVTRCGTTPLAAGVWHHIAGVFDGTAQTMDVYLDGVLDTGPMTSNSVAIPMVTSRGPACPYLGAGSNQSHLFIGTLDEVRVYSRALTAAEIAKLATP